MTTSGTYDWPMTAEQTITQALVDLGALNSGDAPETQETADALVRLNAMLHSWGVRGNLYRDQSGTVVITGGEGGATLPQEVRQINSARYVQSATNHRVLTQWNRDDFYSLPNRSQAGNPVAYYLKRGRDAPEIYVWPVPAADITLELDYGAAPETITDASQTVDIPQEWQEATILGLASRCASMFGTTRIDPATVQRIDDRAAQAYQLLLDSDRPDSYYFEPDR
jgi:hypothetical protein